MTYYFKTLINSILLFLLAQSVMAQANITFQIDLKNQMEDSVFVPSEHSIVLTGNQRPFTQLSEYELKDEEPIDSVYTKQVRFPSSVMGNTLKYNYKIKRPEEGDKTESQPRLLPLEKNNNRVLNPDYFNMFAW